MRWVLISVAIHISLITFPVLFFEQKNKEQEIKLSYEFKEIVEVKSLDKEMRGMRRLHNFPLSKEKADYHVLTTKREPLYGVPHIKSKTDTHSLQAIPYPPPSRIETPLQPQITTKIYPLREVRTPAFTDLTITYMQKKGDLTVEPEKKTITATQENTSLKQAQPHFPSPETLVEADFLDAAESRFYTGAAIFPLESNKDNLETIRHANLTSSAPEYVHLSNQSEPEKFLSTAISPGVETSRALIRFDHFDSSIPNLNFPPEDVLSPGSLERSAAISYVKLPYLTDNVEQKVSRFSLPQFPQDNFHPSFPLPAKLDTLTQHHFAVHAGKFPEKFSPLEDNIFPTEQKLMYEPLSPLTDQVANQASSSSLAHYLKHIAAMIEKNKKYPSRAQKEGIEGKVRISFIITRKGEVKNFRLVAPSEYPELNEAVKALIDELSPFPPLPEDTNKEKITLTMEVTYELKKAP